MQLFFFDGYTTVGYHRLMGIAMGLSWAYHFRDDRWGSFHTTFLGGKRANVLQSQIQMGSLKKSQRNLKRFSQFGTWYEKQQKTPESARRAIANQKLGEKIAIYGHLVGGLEHLYQLLIFPYIGNVIIPTDEVHHFSEGQVDTTNQIIINHHEPYATQYPY